MGPVRKITRSFNSLEYISKARSPQAVYSTTIGIKVELCSSISISINP